MTDISTCAKHIESCVQDSQNKTRLSTFFKSMVLKVKKHHAQYRQRRIDRDAFRNLMSLDDASLRDIGVSRNDIIWASKLALHENASKELEKIRANNVATARWKTIHNK